MDKSNRGVHRLIILSIARAWVRVSHDNVNDTITKDSKIWQSVANFITLWKTKIRCGVCAEEVIWS